MKADTAIMELGRWAAMSPPRSDLPLSPVSLMMSFRTMFDAQRAGGLALVGVVLVGPEAPSPSPMASWRFAACRSEQLQFTLIAPGDDDRRGGLRKVAFA